MNLLLAIDEEPRADSKGPGRSLDTTRHQTVGSGRDRSRGIDEARCSEDAFSAPGSPPRVITLLSKAFGPRVVPLPGSPTLRPGRPELGSVANSSRSSLGEGVSSWLVVSTSHLGRAFRQHRRSDRHNAKNDDDRCLSAFCERWAVRDGFLERCLTRPSCSQ